MWSLILLSMQMICCRQMICYLLLVKSLKIVLKNKLIDRLQNCELHLEYELYLVELLEILKGLGLLEL